jgi:putative inorganic carbon (HCO3(-)) transporter
MINGFLTERISYFIILLFIISNSILIYFDFYYLLALPLLVLLGYLYIYHLDIVFLIIVFCTPLSFNFENLAIGGIGFYFPTETMLLVFSCIFIFKSILNKNPENKINYFKNPILFVVLIQIIWIFFSSITSEFPSVSFKFLLSRSWFIVPLLFYGIDYFKKDKTSTYYFFSSFLSSMLIVTFYTLTNHMLNNFSEESGHWVMWPFFKDHTSYGAILALSIPINFWLIYNSKNKFIKNLLFYFKIKFKWLVGLVIIPLIFIFLNFTEISFLVQKNDAEHTTENFSERLESMSNISSDASNLERLNRWNSAIKLFLKRPFWGWGPGTYSFVYAPFQSSKDLTIISTNFGDGGNAHSEYLGPLAEQGLIGFIINLLLISFLFIYTGLFYIRSENLYYKNLTLVIILSLTTYFSHGLLNNYLDTDKAAVPIWGLISIFITVSFFLEENIEKQRKKFK